jgi:hypothetical protein
MDTFIIGVFRIIACFDEDFESCFHQFGDAATEDSLFAEEVSFGFFTEGGAEKATTGAADAVAIVKGLVLGFAGSILVDSEQARNAAALLVLEADGVAGALGSDEDDIDIGRGYDAVEVDVETMGEGQGFASGQVRLDALS